LPVLRGMIDATNLIKSTNSTLFLILDGLYSNTKYSLVIHLKTIDQASLSSYFQIISNKTIETSVKNKSKMTSAFQLLKLKNNNFDDLNNSEYDIEEEEEEEEEEDEEEEDDYVNDEYSDEFNNNNQNIKERIIGCDLDVADSNKIFTIDYHSSRMIKQITYLFKNKTDFIDYYYNNNNNNKSNLNDLATSLSNFKDFFSLYNFNKDSLHFSVYDECIKQFETNKKANYILLKPLCIFNLESIWESLIKDSKLKNEYFSIQTSIFTKQNSLVHIATACHLKSTTNNLLINELTTTKTTLKSPTLTTTFVVLNHNKLINSDTFDLNDCRIINGNQINFTIKYKNTRNVYKFEIIETNSREHILSNNIKIANNNSNYQVSYNN